jgi:hypothetical protein
MAQDIIDAPETEINSESSLIICKGCGKVVPVTNLCIYCGAPILYGLKSHS